MSGQRCVKASIVALLSVLASISNALGWGWEGHRVVAEIAEQYLVIAATKQVRDLLALENAATLTEVSTWADQIRLQRPETSRWHFVDIPVHPPPRTPATYEAERDCARGDCVVAKITHFAAVLGDQDASPYQRLEALKFIVHFVADIHQPLHCASNNDAGGNGIRVEFNGKLTNLHAVWDTGILAPVVHGDERSYALRLVKSINERQAAIWRGSSPEDWANESHGIAMTVIYQRLPDVRGILPVAYEADMLPIVNEQLRRAGVRLAAVLNGRLASRQRSP